MGAIEIKDVQAKIAEMLKAVESGDTVSITRDGKAVAKLEPVSSIAVQGGKRLPDLSEFRASLNVVRLGNSVIELREQERY